MSKFRFPRLHTCMRTFVALLICSCTMSVLAQPVTWQILGWPLDQDWPGPQGSPATTNANQIVLTGQDVLSVEAFTPPLTISCDVVLPAKVSGATNLFVVAGRAGDEIILKVVNASAAPVDVGRRRGAVA